MNTRDKQRLATRRAILDALGEQIVESGTMGFSVQDVARRAGVTHRTVYNHFPTREALNDAFADHIDSQLRDLTTPPEEEIAITALPALTEQVYPLLAEHEPYMRAYVMLMVASRGPAHTARARFRHFEALVQEEWGPLPPAQARALTAALRQFVSTTAWHVMTEHHGLSNDDACRTATWATRVLLEAISRGDRPHMENPDESDSVP